MLEDFIVNFKDILEFMSRLIALNFRGRPDVQPFSKQNGLFICIHTNDHLPPSPFTRSQTGSLSIVGRPTTSTEQSLLEMIDSTPPLLSKTTNTYGETILTYPRKLFCMIYLPIDKTGDDLGIND